MEGDGAMSAETMANQAYRAGFMSKCAECGVPRHVAEGMLKQATMPGRVKFNTIRRWVNEAIRARALNPKSTGSELLSKQLLDRIKSHFPTISTRRGNVSFDDEFVMQSGIPGMPARHIYRGTGLPDMSRGGHTSSTTVRNAGPNIRHITTYFPEAAHYGSLGLVDVYNARNVPGLMNGRLRFGTNRFVEDKTNGFSDFGAMFDKSLSPEEARDIGRARGMALDVRRRKFDPSVVPEFKGVHSPEFMELKARDGMASDNELLDRLNAERDGILDSWKKMRTDPRAKLGYESALDTTRTTPSRTFQVSYLGGNVRDVTSLQDFARRQKMLLPDGFDLENLTRDSPVWRRITGVNWMDGLTKQQILAAKRYRAIYDILSALYE